MTRQLRQEITASYPLLLTHLTTSLSLSSNLAPIRSSLTSLSSSMDRLHQKIHVPHEQLATLVRRLSVLAQASDLTRRASRFVLVAKRLEGQMQRMSEAESGAGEGEKERELAKAALSVAELGQLFVLLVRRMKQVKDLTRLQMAYYTHRRAKTKRRTRTDRNSPSLLSTLFVHTLRPWTSRAMSSYRKWRT